jgi:hypothetical protein
MSAMEVHLAVKERNKIPSKSFAISTSCMLGSDNIFTFYLQHLLILTAPLAELQSVNCDSKEHMDMDSPAERE